MGGQQLKPFNNLEVPLLKEYRVALGRRRRASPADSMPPDLGRSDLRNRGGMWCHLELIERKSLIIKSLIILNISIMLLCLKYRCMLGQLLLLICTNTSVNQKKKKAKRCPPYIELIERSLSLSKASSINFFSDFFLEKVNLRKIILS